MGIINNDVYVCSNGVQKSGTYISFATETIYVVQNNGSMTPMPNQVTLPQNGTPTYNVRANYRIFWDQSCRVQGKSFIDLKSVNTILTVDQLNNNIYSILYDQLKTIYPNSTDELVYAAPASVDPSASAPVPPVPSVPSAPSAPVDPSASAPSAPVDPSASAPSAPVDPSASAPSAPADPPASAPPS